MKNYSINYQYNVTLYGTKNWENGFYRIKVFGYPEISYIYYSARDAEKNYREKFGLKYKRILWG